MIEGQRINVSEGLNVSPTLTPGAQEATASLEQGFITGARHVHDLVGILLVTYAIQTGCWALAHYRPDLFESEEAASRFYIRIHRVLATGRVVILLALFSKTAFTFVLGGAA